MRALVGLGNPGTEYDGTRHNLGFHVVDLLANHFGLTWKKANDGLMAKGKDFFLFKPMQYMNNSGMSLRSFVDYYNLTTDNLAIVADDVYVAPGSARIRTSGGDGGHNGWKSVLTHLDSDTFWRVKIGCGVYEQHPEKRMSQPPLEAYVLERQAKHDEKRTQELIDKIIPNLVEWLEYGTGLSDQTIHI